MIDDLLTDPQLRSATPYLTAMETVCFEVSDLWRDLPELEWQKPVRALIDTTPSRPVYPFSWWEWRANTPEIDRAMKAEIGRVPFLRSGVLLADADRDMASAFLSVTSGRANVEPMIAEAKREGAASYSCGTIFLQMNDRIVVEGIYVLPLDEQGITLRRDDGLFVIGGSMPGRQYIDATGEAMDESDPVVNASWQVAYFNAMLHVRNVVTQDHVYPEKLQKRRRHDGKEPFKTYKTLHIVTPAEARAHAEGRPVDLSRSTPAHLVRGYYARFTEERPAFGKPWGVGTFWIPSHSRGTKTVGEVEKDYRLSPR